MSPTDRRAWLCALCMSLLSACVGNPAPRHWLATPDAAAEDAYGAWITITLPKLEGAKARKIPIKVKA